ncbi:MAG: lipoyl synthase [bacterium]|nr:lipoyl synthase [bacterium]
MSDLLQIDGSDAGPERPDRRADRPSWLKVRYRQNPELEALFDLVRDKHLNTVCQSAACPNVGECWAQGTATFMLSGNLCTRACGFCDIQTGRPEALDPEEPARVADAVASLGLRFAVLTAVARDDLADGGAAQFAATLVAIRESSPQCRVEVLIPDFKGSEASLKRVLEAEPDVLNHNLETVERLQRSVRKAGRYQRSLDVLANSRRLRPDIPTKTGLMLGLGERPEEIRQALADIRATGCELLTIGQYLSPGPDRLPVDRWVTPEEFDSWEQESRRIGFADVLSGPLVRSSYRAEQLAGKSATG